MTKDINHIIDTIEKKLDKFGESVVEAVSKDTYTNTRRNFNEARFKISGDDPNVFVTRHQVGNEATITCIGQQVLFAEFGAGQKNREYENGLGIDMVTSKSFQYINYRLVEVAPRPDGIVRLGTYGKQLGSNDRWIYGSNNARESKHSHFMGVQSKKGQYLMRTSGTQPIRALWRASNNAIKKLGEGRLKLK